MYAVHLCEWRKWNENGEQAEKAQVCGTWCSDVDALGIFSALCSGGDNGSSSERVTTEAVNVEANYEKELLKEEPETKTIITREDLDRKGARTLSDALAAEQSIQMGTDNMGRKTISIRGAEARHTLILVDGRRLAGGLSKYYGATDEANRLGVDNIDHIEVIRGSGTARYGADAIGGVINIVTKMPHKAGVKLMTEGSWLDQGGSYVEDLSTTRGQCRCAKMGG